MKRLVLLLAALWAFVLQPAVALAQWDGAPGSRPHQGQARVNVLALRGVSGGSSAQTPEATFIAPTVGGFSTTRLGTGSISNIAAGIQSPASGIRLTAPGTSTNTNSLIYAVVAPPAGGNWRATARLRRRFWLGKFESFGLIVRDSASGKSVMMVVNDDTLIGFNRYQFTNDTTFSATSAIAQYHMDDVWIRVTNDGTTRKWWKSLDGFYFQQISSEALSGNFVAAENQVGVVLNPNAGSTTPLQSVDMSVDVYSWLTEATSAGN